MTTRICSFPPILPTKQTEAERHPPHKTEDVRPSLRMRDVIHNDGIRTAQRQETQAKPKAPTVLAEAAQRTGNRLRIRIRKRLKAKLRLKARLKLKTPILNRQQTAMKTRLRKIPEMPLIQPELQQPLKAGEKSRALKGRPKKRPTGRAITKTNCPEQNPGNRRVWPTSEETRAKAVQTRTMPNWLNN